MSEPSVNEDSAFLRAKGFSEKYVARGPYQFFPDAEVVEVVQKGLAENETNHGYRYCP